MLLTTIDPTDLADGLAQTLQLPSRFVLGALAGTRLISVAAADWQSVSLARRARGIGDRNVFARFAGTAFSLLVLSIRRGSVLATAMEARGFGAPGVRTWARPARWGAREWVIVFIGLGIGLTAITAAVLTGTGGRSSVAEARRILIDGRSGSGKTELARAIAADWPEAQLVRMDDLYPGWDGLAAGSALVPELLTTGRYRAWDWATGAPGEERRLDLESPDHRRGGRRAQPRVPAARRPRRLGALPGAACGSSAPWPATAATSRRTGATGRCRRRRSCGPSNRANSPTWWSTARTSPIGGPCSDPASVIG